MNVTRAPSCGSSSEGHTSWRPALFGVVKLDDYGFITDFVEKPKTFVSDLAIIGIYYFNSAEKLMDEINYIMSNDIKQGGEYQLTTALENLRQKGAKFSLGKVDDWMDCGNKNATVETNGKVLNYEKENVSTYPASAKIENCILCILDLINILVFSIYLCFSLYFFSLYRQNFLQT